MKFLFTKSVASKAKSADFESIIGSRCTVVEKIDNYAGCGLVRVGGQQWAARAANEGDIYNVNENLRIVAIEGVKLICRK